MTREDEIKSAVMDSADSLAKPLLEIGNGLGYPPEFVRAVSSVTALRMLGYSTRLAAGSVKWLVMSDEDQGAAMLEGRKPIGYFGHRFDLVRDLPLLSRFEFPQEMHVWAVVGSDLIQDYTPAMQMAAFEEIAGMPWPASSRLPEVIVGTRAELLEHGWVYDEVDKATFFAHVLLDKLLAASFMLLRELGENQQ